MTDLMNSKGVTLTELMVVLAIIVITAAIAIPMYISDLPRQKTKAAAQAMLVDLRLARARAVANNQPYLLCFDSSTTYKLAAGQISATNCGGTIDKAVDFKQNYSGVEFGVGSSSKACEGTDSTEPIYFVNNVARFTERGSSVDGSKSFWTGGVVYLTNARDPDKNAYCVQVEGTTGRAKLYRWDAKTSSWK